MNNLFCCPVTGSPLVKSGESYISEATKERFPILEGIPRFCPIENYSESFGFQWNIFEQTQLDIYSNSSLTEVRFYGSTGWSPDKLSGENILEVGSGAGRFTEAFLRTTKATLHSIDFSNAVEANRRNNLNYGSRLQLAQASIYQMPFADNTFDKVFCLGVLQHTPSFATSIKSLIQKAKVGGEIVVDFYPIKGWYTKIHSKYIFRPITKRMPKRLLLNLIRLNIRWMLIAFDLLCAIGCSLLTRFIPITDVRSLPPTLSRSQRREWAIMDTFDGLSPEYDSPQRVEDVKKMFTSNGCDISFAGVVNYSGGSSTVVRAIKRS